MGSLLCALFSGFVWYVRVLPKLDLSLASSNTYINACQLLRKKETDKGEGSGKLLALYNKGEMIFLA